MIRLSRLLAGILLLSVLLTGCSTPIGVRHLAPHESYKSSMANPLSGDQVSSATTVILHRFKLTGEWAKDPTAVIRTLHERALTDKRRDILFALAELSYFEGEHLHNSTDPAKRRNAPDFFLLSAVYAYYAVLDPELKPAPSLFDRRMQTACDLYNFSLWRGLANGRSGEIEIRAGTRQLPIGKMEIKIDATQFPWDLGRFEKFEAADAYAIRGLSVRNRNDGLGAPIIAVRRSQKDNLFGSQAIPATAFLRLDDRMPQLGNGVFRASLELYSAYEDKHVVVADREIPLETDTSVTTAYKLAEEAHWSFGIDAFLGRLQDVPSRLLRFQPYEPDRIPVVFVHGTLSSPVWWAEMINTLSGDPVLGKKYQFWYFFYNSSRLITVSALDLRQAIEEQVHKLDPDGTSAAMRNMVVIGHSQGGLLAKLTAIDTGDRLLQTVINGRLEDLRTREESRQLIRENMVIRPVSAVRRVVFISTPHRGSYLSKSFARNLVHRAITLPVTLVEGFTGIYSFLSDNVKSHWQGKIPTSVDAMSPDDPLLQAIAETPLADGVKGHSIIAVREGKKAIQEGDDGVVTYASAHLEGLESEFIVQSCHSCQDKPETIEEVRRILLQHLEESPAPDLSSDG
jgi:pimeloyl-ACP methyl ester carboxylesterase